MGLSWLEYKHIIFDGKHLIILAVLGCGCRVQTCSRWGYSLVVALWLVAVASPGARALGRVGFRLAARGLSSCSSQTLERRLSSCGSQA